MAEGESRIIITFDHEWVPDPILQYSVDLLDEYGIPATFFMTNRTDVDMSRHELAIHPNFRTLDLAQHVAEVHTLFPQATGSRSHSLFSSERLRPVYEDTGILYQSNYMMYLAPHIGPLPISGSTYEFPLFWMDYFYLEMEERPTFALDAFNLGEPGLKVFDFHPSHIYLNTESLSRYEAAKEHYKDPDRWGALQNDNTRGIRDLFLDLLRFIVDQGQRSLTLADLRAQISV